MRRVHSTLLYSTLLYSTLLYSTNIIFSSYYIGTIIMRSRREKEEYQFIKGVVTFVWKYSNRRHTEAEIAARFHTTEKTLRRKIKSRFHTGLPYLRNSIRLLKLSYIAGNNNQLDIYRLAARTGFSDGRSFRRCWDTFCNIPLHKLDHQILYTEKVLKREVQVVLYNVVRYLDQKDVSVFLSEILSENGLRSLS